MTYLPFLTVPFDLWMEKSGHLQVTDGSRIAP
jgi:hypothetical protein